MFVSILLDMLEGKNCCFLSLLVTQDTVYANLVVKINDCGNDVFIEHTDECKGITVFTSCELLTDEERKRKSLRLFRGGVHHCFLIG